MRVVKGPTPLGHRMGPHLSAVSATQHERLDLTILLRFHSLEEFDGNDASTLDLHEVKLAGYSEGQSALRG